MLKILCPQRVADTRRFAARVGKLHQFNRLIEYLEDFGCRDRDDDTVCCELHPDFAPYSFTVEALQHTKQGYVHWLTMGLIYHGPEGDPCAVTLEPCDGWSLHS